MKPWEIPASAEVRDEVAALIQTLHRTEQRLEALTGGEVDTVSSGSGRPFVLRRAQEQLRHNDAAKQDAILNALPAHIAMLDAQGVIVSVNEAWRGFGRANLSVAPGHGVGLNYLDVCDRAQGPHSDEAHRVAAGIRAVLEGTSPGFTIEYPCHAPAEHRWFLLMVTPVAAPHPNGAVVMHLNITERRQAGEKLRESEIRFAGAFEQAPSGVALVSPDGRWLKVNRSLCDLLGYPEAELLGRTFQHITHPEDLVLDLDNVGQLLAGDIRCYEMEKRYIKAQGQLVTVLLNVSLVRDAHDRPAYFIAHIQDISARKQAEATLRQEQALLSSLISSIPDHIYIKDRQSCFVRINASMAQHIGVRDPGEAVGKADLDFFSAEHAQRAYRQEQTMMATGEAIIGLEERETWSDGRVAWSSTTKVPLRNPAGEIVGLIGVARDITERREVMEALRESNEMFHQLADNITDAFWIRSPDMSSVQYVSPAFEKIWGRSVASLQANPLEWTNYILAEDRARVIAAYATLSPAKPHVDTEYRIVRPDGEIRWIRVRASLVKNDTDLLTRHVGIVTDITESKQVNDHLLQAQKMEALGQFSGGVAHDFNNILAAISGYTELARMQLPENSAVSGHLDSVLKASDRAADLVRQILTFSRQQPQTRAVLLLQPIVVESMKLMRATIPTTVEIEALIAADAPTVLANANQVHQVLMNLAVNGWHALKSQPGRLQVKLENVTVDAAYAASKPRLRSGTYARLSVSDTGCGMDPSTLRRIFEPFFTTKPLGEGTGLGLAVVHGIMETHDGAVTVHSQPGEGTVFRLYFPEHVGDTAAGPGETGPTPRGRGERVLVVDDEDMLAKMGATLLTRLGYAAESTTGSAKALELVRANPSRYDLVMTDQTMPGMTGLQLALQLREIQPGLRILLMTGYNLSLTADRLGASGVGNILHKPFTMHTLGTSVHATLIDQTFHDQGQDSSY
jgi:PAS domain S-box-containing protein